MTRNPMTTAAHVLLAALLATFALAGCKKADDAAEAPAKVLLTAPASDDDAQWKAYLQQEFQLHQEGITDRQYVYYLPANSETNDEGDSNPYGRQLDNVTSVVARTVLPGNQLAFGSPDSAKMADLIVAAFKDAKPDALKGSQVLFVGLPADSERVKAAVTAAGANYIFVEAK